MVLNGRTEGTVATSTQQRVRDAAAELGYTRSAVAISLREQRTRTIGLITDEIATSPFAGRMARAASMVAAKQDYLVITVDLSLRDHSVSDTARLLAERQVDGLLYATMGRVRVPAPQIPPGIPLVLVNCELEDPATWSGGPVPPSFLPDDYGGARRAARRLLETGHRRIVMLSGGDGTVADVEREAGFRDELTAAGLGARVVPAGWQMDDGYRAVARLLAEDEPPTGLFCMRDRVAGGALQAAAAAGVDVPTGLSVIGFDDEDFFAECLTPPLTTIALPHVEMGERAMTALLALLEGDGVGGSAAGAGSSADAVGVSGGLDVEGVLASAMRHVSECPLVERGSVASASRG